MLSFYKYKDQVYFIIYHGKMKHPIARTWEDCVIYSQMGNPIVYVRDKVDFFKKFKPI